MDAYEAVIRFFTAEEQKEMRLFSSLHPTEIRIRTGRRGSVVCMSSEERFGDVTTPQSLMALISRMLEHSVYAWEDELGQGYFTLPFGVRVGITGRFKREAEETRLVAPTSLLIRIAREVKGASEKIRHVLVRDNILRSTLILSPPGMGKTTLLRDVCRMLGEEGKNVSLVDERGEIAAVKNGQAQLDAGDRTDVCEGVFKSQAIMMLIRSMAPDVIVLDEIGSKGDAQAIYEASRMGVCVVASAHAQTMEDALSRPMLSEIMKAGTFENICILKGKPGNVDKIYVFSEGKWRLNSSQAGL